VHPGVDAQLDRQVAVARPVVEEEVGEGLLILAQAQDEVLVSEV
jgi:hypothetical protein